MNRKLNRRAFLGGGAASLLAGCHHNPEKPDRVWGHRGVVAGDLVRPRAIAILPGDRLYIVDFTARIQAYDAEGKYLGVTFTTPDFRNGRPSGLATARDGNLIVSDSHYATVRIYSPTGEELKTVGGERGNEPGQFIYISDAIQLTDDSWIIAEFGGNERMTKLDANGKPIRTWGRLGTADGEFNHIRALAEGADGVIYVADASNHRIQVFDADGKHVRSFGTFGSEPGQFAYPYDVAFGPHGDLYVIEHGNHRVQKMSNDGSPIAQWGSPGREPGKLYNPWALAADSRDNVHVVDTENHRIQRVKI